MIPPKILWLQRGRKSPWISYWGPKRKGSWTPDHSFSGADFPHIFVQGIWNVFWLRDPYIYKQTFICHWKMGKGGRSRNMNYHELPVSQIPTPLRFGRLMFDQDSMEGCWKMYQQNMVSFLTSWWFQPIWKIWSSNWIISPNKDENKKYLKPPPSSCMDSHEAAIVYDKVANVDSLLLFPDQKKTRVLGIWLVSCWSPCISCWPLHPWVH